VQEDLRRREYHVAWQETPLFPGAPAGYQAPNRAQGLRVGFYPDGVHAVARTAARSAPGQPQHKPWTWGIALLSLAQGDATRQLPQAQPIPQANRVEYRRGAVTEWYTNDERGLEHTLHISTLQLPTSNFQSLTSNLQHPPSNLHPPTTLELALTGDLTPRVAEGGQAIEFTAPDGAPLLHYGPPRATDTAGRSLPVHLALVTHHAPRNTQYATRNTHHAPRTTHHLLLTLDDATASSPLTLHLPLTALPASADWVGESDQAQAHLGAALSTAGDVDGDGYGDLIVGAPDYDGGQAGEGAAFVYHGGPGGLVTPSAWFTESNQVDARFGAAVSLAGDVNGDGYADVVVGAPDYDGQEQDQGAAFVYHGGPGGLVAASAWFTESGQAGAHFGAAVSLAGDVNDDGYDDLLVGAPDYDGQEQDEGAALVYRGGPSGIAATPSWTAHPTDQSGAGFGATVSTAGDVNGDGYADVAVGAPDYDGDQAGEGAAFAYLGSATGLAAGAPAGPWAAQGNQENAHFGAAVSTAGDVNGDGYADLLVGAPDYDGGQADEGAARVYHGGPHGLASSPARTLHPTDQSGAGFGTAVSLAGDVNGDGYADVAVGAPDYDDVQPDEGAAFVHLGGPDGLDGAPAWNAHPTDQGLARFGAAIAVAGDVDGDGYGDLAVGAPGYDRGHTDEGAAFVYHGTPDGLDTAPAWYTMGQEAGDFFGWSVSPAGDVNGDGYADLLVGAPRYDGGQTEEGAAFLYPGGPDGPATLPAWQGESDQQWAWFGYAVSAAGDVNGDGYGDVIVGTPRYSGEEDREGAAFVYHGGPTGLVTATTWLAHPTDQADARFGIAVSTAGDVNGDGYADVVATANGYDGEATNEGAAFVYHGGPTGLVTTTTWLAHPTDQAYANFGRSAAAAGDVNGDGYSDVAIGASWYDGSETDEGAAFVYYGGPTGLTSGPADWTVVGDRNEAQWGTAISTAGDVDGDGYADLLVGAYRYTGEEWREGAAFVYHGGSEGLSTDPGWSATGGQNSAKFGLSVSTAGDVNGDGYADVVVGAPYHATDDVHVGAAFVYHGGPAGLAVSPAWSVAGDQEGAGYGFAVSTAGDVNGDGYGDLVVGAPSRNGPEGDEGRALVYLGNEGGGPALRPRQLRSDGSAPVAPLGLSSSATQVRLQVDARSPLGREPVALEWQLAPLGAPFTATSAISGTSPAWHDVVTTGLALSQTVSGLTGDTVYRWRARILYRPGNRLGQSGGRWLYLGWNGPHEADFRTPALLAHPSHTQRSTATWRPDAFLPVLLRRLPEF
jgi:hypothetical protein